MSKPLHTLTADEFTAIADSVAAILMTEAKKHLVPALAGHLAGKVTDGSSVATTAGLRAIHRSRGWNDPEVDLGAKFDRAKILMAEAVREALVIEARAELAAS